MALLWSETIDDKTYEVRSAGSTRRLYTNGAFHSQYNPNQPVTGNVWDLLFLPAMFAPQGSIRRVLVLGVGGGAVINQLNHFIQPDSITGVELDPVHITVAREHFGLNQANIELVCEDARHWVDSYQGEPFDLIIDDLFVDGDGEPFRPIDADVEWFEQLLSMLNPEGTLVFNFGDPYELKECGFFQDRKLAQQFRSLFQLTTPLYENAIGAFHQRYHKKGDLGVALQQVPELDQQRSSCRLSFEIKPVLGFL